MPFRNSVGSAQVVRRRTCYGWDCLAGALLHRVHFPFSYSTGPRNWVAPPVNNNKNTLRTAKIRKLLPVQKSGEDYSRQNSALFTSTFLGSGHEHTGRRTEHRLNPQQDPHDRSSSMVKDLETPKPAGPNRSELGNHHQPTTCFR
jgi:hypothetical protein